MFFISGKSNVIRESGKDEERLSAESGTAKVRLSAESGKVKVRLSAESGIAEERLSAESGIAEGRSPAGSGNAEGQYIREPYSVKVEIFILKFSLERFLEICALFLSRKVKHAVPLAFGVFIERLASARGAHPLVAVANKGRFEFRCEWGRRRHLD